MRQTKRQKANAKLKSTLWNAVWQLSCPWVMGGEIPPLQPIPVKSSTRRNRLRSFAALFFVSGLLFISHQPQAFAKDGDAPIVLASLNANVPKQSSYAAVNLFGTSEQRYTDISAFTKWEGVLKRFNKTFKNSMREPKVQQWLGMLAGLENASPEEKIEKVNAYMNKVKFLSDADNYGVRDYWATPMEFMQNGGDCEDYAFAKYVSLQALGFNKNDMRLAIVYDHVMRMPHAVLVVYDRGQAKILDNQNPAVLESAEITRYKPIYSISEVAWWRH